MKKFSIFLLFICISGAFSQKATVTEIKQKFTTYSFGDPNPIARMTNIYPYFRFDGYSNTGIEKEWKIIILENDYIKVYITPEIGGKVWGAVEKSTGKDFIYFNKVVKFRDIAMRGAWTSGGIEFNFGDIGHTPATATPVDYLTKENPDGSVSCFIGGIDLPSRTEWRVEIKLQKDKAYFETKSAWYNPTGMNTSFYNWSNAAIEASDDLHLYYPGKIILDHDGSAKGWPIDQNGKDLSIYGNNKFESHKSYHVMGEYTKWFGGVWEDRRFGIGHYSLYEDKPGKKIWLWSLARNGGIWKDLLTDPGKGNKQYVEIQTGLLFNQAAANSTHSPFKHYSFSPGNVERFEEAWFPVKDLKNIVDANLYGALSAKISGDSLEFAFCPLQPIENDLYIRSNNKIIYSKKLNLSPLQTFKDVIKINGSERIEILLGNRLLYYSNIPSEIKTLQRPVLPNKDFDWNSVYGIYTSGIEKARQRDYNGALKELSKVLERDPNYNPALTALSEIYFRRMEYSKALDLAAKALANDTYDPDANFIYGIINKQINNKYDAIDGFTIAKYSLKYRSAAYINIAEIYFKHGEYESAKEFAEKALEYNTHNMQALKLLAITERTTAHFKECDEILNEILTIDPLNHFARFEKYLLAHEPAKLDIFRTGIRNELPANTYTENAIYYVNLGLFKTAIELLINATGDPVVDYWLSYLYNITNKPLDSKKYFKKAVETSPAMVYPFRQETALVLEWAKSMQNNWKTDYYLALIYTNLGQLDRAKLLFNEIGNQPDYAPFYLSRAAFYKTADKDKVLPDYETSLKLDENQWRTYHLLTEYYNDLSQYDKSILYAKKGLQKFPESYILKSDLAKSYLYNKQYKEALQILSGTMILPYEGARDGRDLYWMANILQSLDFIKDKNYKKALTTLEKSELWPENLGVGKPYDVDNRLESFLRAVCYKNMMDKNNEIKYYNEVVKSTFNTKAPNSLLLLTALTYKELKNDFAAEGIFMAWVEKDPQNIITKWAYGIFNGSRESKNELIKEGAFNEIDNPAKPGGDQYVKIIFRLLNYLEKQ